MHNLDSGDRKPAKDPKPNEPSRKRSLYGCLGAILLLVLILVLFGACALIGGEEEETQSNLHTPPKVELQFPTLLNMSLDGYPLHLPMF